MSKHIVLGVTRYNMTDKETGEKLMGAKVYYLPETPENEEDRAGSMPLELAGPFELFEKLKKAANGKWPLECELTFGQKMANVGQGRRKVVVTLASAEPLLASAK